MGHQALELNSQKIEFFQQPADDDKITQVMIHRIDHRHPLPVQFPLGRYSPGLDVQGLYRIFIDHSMIARIAVRRSEARRNRPSFFRTEFQ